MDDPFIHIVTDGCSG